MGDQIVQCKRGQRFGSVGAGLLCCAVYVAVPPHWCAVCSALSSACSAGTACSLNLRLIRVASAYSTVSAALAALFFPASLAR